MRGRMLLWLSLGLNVALAAWLWLGFQAPPEHPDTLLARVPASIPTVTTRTNVLIRRQNFVWNQIESADYPTFIANLRLIGCPEPTIRDIIVADVTQAFARRRAVDVVTPAQQWWRSEPDTNVVRGASDAIRRLEVERRALLTQLLGRDWESSDYPYPAPFYGAALDGPLLGALTAQAKAAVQEVERNALERQQDYLEAQARAGQEADPAELARLRQETRQQLAQVLSPSQLEEYLLRYSSSASELRDRLRGVEVSPEEFRTLFRELDTLDQQAQSARGEPSPEAQRRVQDLTDQRTAALQQLLGTERYQALEQNQDPLYRQARSVIEQAGASSEQLVSVAAIVRLTDEEQRRIRQDVSLTAEERVERLAATREAQRDSLRTLLGEQAYRRYLESTPRLLEEPAP